MDSGAEVCAETGAKGDAKDVSGGAVATAAKPAADDTATTLSEKQSEIRAHYGAVAACSTDACAAARGCGTPLEQAQLQPGDYVLDLGCGGGREAVLAASRVGRSGHVFGLDMTPEMLELARRFAEEAGADNVSFLHGFIEDIPLPERSVDVVVSNCVINLSDDKPRVLREARRVLRDGGRFIVADIVLCRASLPDEQRAVAAPLLGCVNGVLSIGEYERLMREAGFSEMGVEVYRRYSAKTLRSRAEARGQQERWARLIPDSVDDAFGGAFIRGKA